MDHKEIMPSDTAVEFDNKAEESESYNKDQLYQSFSPFDLSEILSKEAELIEEHYNNRFGWNFWGKTNDESAKKKQFLKKRSYYR